MNSLWGNKFTCDKDHGLSEQSQQAFDVHNGAATFVIEATVDVVRGAIDDREEGRCSGFLPCNRILRKLLAFGEVAHFISKIVEFAQGGIARKSCVEDCRALLI